MGLADKKPWSQSLSSLDIIFAGIRYLNLPAPQRELLELLFFSSEKPRFMKALEESLQLTGETPSTQTKQYITGMTTCLSSDMQHALETLGYKNIPGEILLHIGATNGYVFRNAIKSAVNKGDPNNQSSILLIDNSLKEASEITEFMLKAPVRMQMVPVSAQQKTAASAMPVTHKQNQAHRTEPAHDEISNRDDSDSDNEYLSAHAFGSTSAMCFNAAQSINKRNHTILLDAAVLVGDRWDWANAIHIQIDNKELPLLYGVLMGWHNSVKFDAHGEANEKCFEIERQPGKYFAKVMAKGKSPRAIPIVPKDAYSIAMVVFTQIMKQVPRELKNHPEIVIHMMKQTQNIAKVEN